MGLRLLSKHEMMVASPSQMDIMRPWKRILSDSHVLLKKTAGIRSGLGMLHA